MDIYSEVESFLFRKTKNKIYNLIIEVLKDYHISIRYESNDIARIEIYK